MFEVVETYDGHALIETPKSYPIKEAKELVSNIELGLKLVDIDWKTVLRNWQTDDDGVPDDSDLYFELKSLVENDDD